MLSNTWQNFWIWVLACSFQRLAGDSAYDTPKVVKPIKHWETIASHDGYPTAFYNRSSEAKWKILPLPQSSNISFVFEDFELELSEGCQHDFVKIFGIAAKFGRACGKQTLLQNTAIIFNNVSTMGINVVFKTDLEIEGRGFKMKRIPFEKQLQTCYHILDDREQHGKGTFGVGTLFSKSCKFYITVPAERLVKVTFKSFNLCDCSSEKLIFYDVKSHKEVKIGEYCASNIPTTVYSSSFQLAVERVLTTPNSNCDKSNGFVAEYEGVLYDEASRGPHKCVDDGYILVDNFCYKLYKEDGHKTWVGAEEVCFDDGSELLSITSKDEMRWIKTYLEDQADRAAAEDLSGDSFSPAIYIGLHNRGPNNGEYRWTDKLPFVFAEWSGLSDLGFDEFEIPDSLERIIKEDILQPNNDNSFRCTMMLPLASPHYNNWIKIPCHHPLCDVGYMCKKRALNDRNGPLLPPVNPRQKRQMQPRPPRPLKETKVPHIQTVLNTVNQTTIPCPQNSFYVANKCVAIQMSVSNLTIRLPRSDFDQYISYSQGTVKELYELRFDQANTLCTKIGGKMAKITNDNKEQYIQHLQNIAPQVSWLPKMTYKGVKNISASIMMSDESNNCLLLTSKDYRYEKLSELLQCDKSEFQVGAVATLCEVVSLPTLSRCHISQFQCNNGECISVNNICDGDKDCADGEDEFNCTCGENYFKCKHTSDCISLNRVCDFNDDCRDGSDEDFCNYPPCEDNEFRCGGGQCIQKRHVCDNNNNCPDGSDEKSCNNKGFKCAQDTFTCYSGQCLDIKHKSDLFPDCTGPSQEDEIDISQTCDISIKSSHEERVYCQESDSLRCKPNHGHCYTLDHKCIDKTPKNAKAPCAGFEHLQNCEDFECPNMFKCRNSFCVPVDKVCDGIQHCPGGDDEMPDMCRSYRCPTYYTKCKQLSKDKPSGTRCVNLQQVCDGIKHCPLGDDEHFCALKRCPDGCECIGNVINCAERNLTDFALRTHVARSIRALLLSRNILNITSSTFETFLLLVKLDLSYNGISNIIENSFSMLSNLVYLDLSNNEIPFIPSYAFNGLGSLLHIDLTGNPITNILAKSFHGLTSLTELNLQRMNFKNLPENCFQGLDNLVTLNLSFSGVDSVDDHAFANLTRLRNLDLSGNKLSKIRSTVFDELNLKEIHFKSSSLCCLVGGNTAKCFPEPDEFSSCSDLMQNNFLQVSIWVLAVIALFGNGFVIGWWIKKRKFKVATFLVFNLGIADFLMGVYLLIIASKDVATKGHYFIVADQWKDSGLCKFAGFLSMLSSEMSVYMLILITVDRVIAIVFAMKVPKLTMKAAIGLVVAGWVFWVLMSALPTFGIDYFVQFYGHNSVCLPFTLTSSDYGGIEYALAIFVVFNMVAFIGIAIGYVALVSSVYRSRHKTGQNLDSAEEKKLLKKVAVILLTDFMCWLPITILGILSVSGVSIPNEVSAYIIVFVLPINSALNPLLYTLPFVKLCRKKSTHSSSGGHSNGTHSTYASSGTANNSPAQPHKVALSSTNNSPAQPHKIALSSTNNSLAQPHKVALSSTNNSLAQPHKVVIQLQTSEPL